MPHFSVIPMAIAAAVAVGISSGCAGGAGASDATLIRQELYADYRFGSTENVIDIGIQPLFATTGLISGAMARDEVLREELLELGFEVRFHPFLKGHDVNSFLLAGDLEGGVGGDMPALTAATGLSVRVTSLMQAGFVSIVANRPMLLKDLRGGKIGYAHGSSAHYSLIRALSSAGVTDDQVRLIHMEVNDMAPALDRGEIRAFSAWEPFAALSELTSDQSTVIHRSQSTGYLYLSEVFLERSPQAARQIVAAEIRAAAWIRHDRANLLRAAEWSLVDAAPLWAVPAVLTAERVAELAEEDLFQLDGPGLIPPRFLEPGGALQQEFEFLQEIDEIPPDAAWSDVRDAFDRALMSEILMAPAVFRLDEYAYAMTVGG